MNTVSCVMDTSAEADKLMDILMIKTNGYVSLAMSVMQNRTTWNSYWSLNFAESFGLRINRHALGGLGLAEENNVLRFVRGVEGVFDFHRYLALH